MKKRDLLLSVLLALLAFLAVGIFHNSAMALAAVKLIQEFREPETSLRLDTMPYVFAFVRIVAFYLVAGAAAGLLLAVVAALLTRPVRLASNGDTGQDERQTGRAEAARPRRRYYLAFAGLLVGFLVYVHLRMVTLYPGLFRNAYRYAWFPGNPTWVFLVHLSGIIAVVVIGSAIVVRHRQAISRKLTRGPAAVAGVVALAVVAGGVGQWLRHSRPPEMSNQGPNIIFLGVDSVRPDHISRLGYKRTTTPYIDAFLNEAVRFDQAFVPLCRTYPSLTALLTGCNPPRTGVRFDLPPRETYKPPMPLLSEHLKASGYTTAFFLNNTNYTWAEPSLGFDHIEQPEHNAVDFYLSHIQPKAILYYFFLNNRWGYYYDRGIRNNVGYVPIYRPPYFDADVVAYWQRMRGSAKFFALVHLCNLHAPFSVNYPYSTFFASVRKPVFNRFTYQILVEEIARRKEVGERWSIEEAERVYTQEINLYDALLRSTDDSVGRILEGLKRAGLYDNSMIVLFSDHGEHLFSNGLRYRYRNSNHGNHMWGDDDQRVLLAIKFPQGRHAGAVVKRLVRSIDVAPTVLDALALPPLDQAEGVPLMPYIEGTTENMHLIAYAETGMTLDDFFFPRHLGYSFTNYFELHYIDNMRVYKKLEYMPNMILAKDRMVRDERWKLILYPIVTDRLELYSELFDLAVDPKNINDVSTSHPAERDRLRLFMKPYLDSDWKQWGPGLTDLPISTGTAAMAPKALLERFRREPPPAAPDTNGRQ